MCRHMLFSKFRYERNFNLFHVINEENIIERGHIAYGEIHHLVKVLGWKFMSTMLRKTLIVLLLKVT